MADNVKNCMGGGELMKDKLLQLGLTEEQVGKVLGLTKQAISDEIKDKFIPKTRLDEVINEKNHLQETLDKREATLQELSNSAELSSELQEKITKLETTLQEKEEEFQAERLRDKKVAKIKEYLGEQERPPHNLDDFLNYIDLDEIQLLDSGKVLGIEEAYQEQLSARDYMFVSNQITPKGKTVNQGQSPEGDNPKGDDDGGIGNAIAGLFQNNNSKASLDFFK